MKIQWPKWALAVLFLVDGTGFGLWAAHVPVFKQNLHLGNGALSEVLLSLVGGGIVTMPLTGVLIARFGSRNVVRTVAVLYVAMLAGLAHASSWGVLIALACLYGGTKGALDVTVNAQAIAVEQFYGRSSMSLLQGCWSVGGLIGAGIASVLLNHGYGVRFNLTAGAIVMGTAVFAVLPLLVTEQRKTDEAKVRFVLPDASLLRLALIVFFGLFAEGAIGDWAAVYLRSNLKASLSLAAAGYATYAIAMASARFLGDWLIRRFEDKLILIGSGLLIALGFGLTLVARSLPVAIFGLVLTGMGVANVVPVIMTLTGKNTRMGAGPAISAVSTIGYFGFLAGPPLIGWLAVAAGLDKALGLVVLAGVIVAAGPIILPAEKKVTVEARA